MTGNNGFFQNKSDLLREAFLMSRDAEYASIPPEGEVALEFSDEFFDRVASQIGTRSPIYNGFLNSMAKKVAVIAAVFIFAVGGLMTVRAIREPVIEFVKTTYEKIFPAKEETDTPPDTDSVKKEPETEKKIGAITKSATDDETPEKSEESAGTEDTSSFSVVVETSAQVPDDAAKQDDRGQVAKSPSDTEDKADSETNISEADVSAVIVADQTSEDNKDSNKTSDDQKKQQKSDEKANGAINRATPTESGNLSEGINWSYDPVTTVLIIEGSGDIPSDAFDTLTDSVKNKAIYMVIKEGITGISDRAFWKCNKLMHVYLPSGISNIGKQAFMSCSQLRTVNVPASVRTIGEGAFANDEKLYEATLSDGLVTIEKSAFYGCSSLTSVYLSPTITYIGKGAFKLCTSLQAVDVTGSAEICDEAFSKCSSLTEVNVCVSGSIGKSAFSGCGNIVNAVITGEICEIGPEAFYSCNHLKALTLSCKIQSVGKAAFDHCGLLSTVRITGMTEEEWANVAIGRQNKALEEAEKVFE